MSGSPETIDELIFPPRFNWILHVTQAVKIQFKLGKKSRSSDSKFQTRECQKPTADSSPDQSLQWEGESYAELIQRIDPRQ